ncbi:uncharacterized protein HMPREF1541_04595 [Cyphellophora europaea CBS 101466]|uniref:Conserved oligomeric Golgi complex subunit 1 n=1 Tax=Cyphellophora europaea (strain CBS 101466) TaxID=1220924 RepID=W2RX86_CYPE1|nr:uncharacterized protein HMPREF1541_04595 [Cyphellophora europaea CBS 101466]ETN40319.1 hypothetical protein HMPREF1541_04595 [Cyphellophora europaea CBS 101466]
MDPTLSLQRWQQAFEDHPISTTRSIEKQLRANVANNRERLRGLVGGNYRDLLSTADQIVSLDRKTRATESRISDLGQLCSPPSKPETHTTSTHSQTIAELWLLQRCLDATKSSVSQGDLLRAAHTLVISRLLLKSLSNKDDKPASLDILQGRVTSLRRHTLLRIDTILSSPHSSSAKLVRSACAYCLITSASSADAFKYAQRLRLERLRKTIEVKHIEPHIAVGVLRYLLSTSQVLRRVFGTALTDALSTIQRRPILLNIDLVGSDLAGSNDILGLISDDIRSFSPYFKRDPVSASDFTRSLELWTSEACEILAAALDQQLSCISDVSEVLGLRRELYTVLLPLYFNSTSCAAIHQTVQQKATDRIGALVTKHMSELGIIAQKIIEAQSDDSQSLELWRSEVATMSVAGGGAAFLNHVHRRYHGTTSHMLNLSRSLNQWIALVQHTSAAFESSRLVRWRDLLEEPDDEQEDEAAELIEGLARSDPDTFSTQSRSSLKTCVAAFESKLVQAASLCLKDEADVTGSVHYLRAIRTTLHPLRQAFPEEAGLVDLASIVPELYARVAEEVVERVLAPLKEGSDQESAAPLIDNLPSPSAFNLLQALCTTMTDVGGSDVWSRAAVAGLKTQMRAKVLTEDSPFIRNEFDQAYLGCALGSTKEVTPQAALPEKEKAAREYWTRTKLLFGALAD